MEFPLRGNQSGYDSKRNDVAIENRLDKAVRIGHKLGKHIHGYNEKDGNGH